MRAAAAVELVHMATLVHDDVLDGAPLRRGAPDVVADGGRGAATATGDLLFSRAFAELAADGGPEAVAALSRASSALARGELMQRADAWSEGRAARALPAALRAQDGAPVRGRVPARRAAGGAGPECADALGQFGTRIGLAFQILDDVLDVSGPTERTGKQRGTDLLDGTVTLPLILARERDGDLRRLDLREVRDRAPSRRRRSATGSRRPARSARRASRRSTSWPRRRRRCTSCPLSERQQKGARPGGRRRRGALRLEVFGEERLGLEGRDEALDLVAHVRVHEPLEVVDDAARCPRPAPRRTGRRRPGRRRRWQSTRSSGSAARHPSAPVRPRSTAMG